MIDFIKIHGEPMYTPKEMQAKFSNQKTITWGKNGLCKKLVYEKRNVTAILYTDERGEEPYDDFYLSGSLHRYYTKRSYSDFHFSSFEPALVKMCNDFGLDIAQDAEISIIEIGVNLKMDNNPDDYFPIFKTYVGRYFDVGKKLAGVDRPHGLELTLTELIDIKIYNKTVYSKKIEGLKPTENILRLEVRFKKRGIREYGLPTHISELMHKDSFQRYVDKFVDIIDRINKANVVYDYSKLKGTTLRNMVFMNNVREYNEYLKCIKGRKKECEQERARMKKVVEATYELPNLKKELDEKFSSKIAELMK